MNWWTNLQTKHVPDNTHTHTHRCATKTLATCFFLYLHFLFCLLKSVCPNFSTLLICCFFFCLLSCFIRSLSRVHRSKAGSLEGWRDRHSVLPHPADPRHCYLHSEMQGEKKQVCGWKDERVWNIPSFLCCATANAFVHLVCVCVRSQLRSPRESV